MAIASRDAFTDFFRDPSRETLQEIITLHPEETNSIDFKKDWDESPKIARHLLAMANGTGGIIIHGVEETNGVFATNGVLNKRDKADIAKGLNSYLPAKLIWDVKDFTYPENHELTGKIFQIVIVNYNPGIIPLVSMSDGTGINQNRIYVRRMTESAEASYEEIQDIIRRRLSSTSLQSRKLVEHLGELRVLYDSIDRYLDFRHFAALASLGANPRYPKEDFESFVVRMIDVKKNEIREIIEGS